MSLSVEQNAFLNDVAKLIEFVNAKGEMLITGGELFRTPEQEELYVKEGKSKTMNSYHLKRLAIDINFIIVINGLLVSDKVTLQKYGDYWESLSPVNKWGGNFSTIADTDHFERHVS
jgi:D-alanyl-D-alanine carboxypeptidase